MKNEITDLRTARKRAGLTQESLAGKTGIDQGTVSRLEGATTGMSMKMARKFARHVSVESEELVIANRLAALKRAKVGGMSAA